MSPVTLARLMEELFPDELHAWHAAQTRGTPLADHVTKSHTLSIDEAGDATTKPRGEPDAEPDAEIDPPARARASRRGLALATLALATLASAAIVLVARHGSRSAAHDPLPAVVAPVVVAPPPTTVAPVPKPMPPPTPLTTPAAPVEARATARRRVQHVAKKPPPTKPSGHWDSETAVLPH
jgi:hypothetical protein